MRQSGNRVRLADVGAVCDECARAAGYEPKDKAVGVWMGECGICHRVKACTDLHHDWRKTQKRTGRRPSITRFIFWSASNWKEAGNDGRQGEFV